MEGDESDDESFNDDKNDKDFHITDYKYENDSENSYDDDMFETVKTENEENSVNEESNEAVCYPGGHQFDKKLICVCYPGKVLNPDKAIETLGGITSISNTVNTPNRRLELRFRPSDGYCKPACADRHEVTGLLLRIRVKKSRVKHLEALSKKNEPLKRDTVSAMPKNCSKQGNQKLDDLMTKIRRCSVKADHSYGSRTDEPNESPETSTNKLARDRRGLIEQNLEDLSEDRDYELPKLKVLGRICTEFRFTGLCDFQYLPITVSLDNPSKNECIYQYLYPKDIPSFKWLDNKVPYFLPPAVFSRMDSVQQYNFKTESSDTGPEKVIGKTRKRRVRCVNLIDVNSTAIPSSPPSGIDMGNLPSLYLEQIKALFNERPIWSKAALMYKTKFNRDQLKILLPSVAYYFKTGPWRIMWVKLGYDPRTDPSSRIYQTLDYRLKPMHGLDQIIKSKRNYSNYVLPHKSASISKPKTAILTNMLEIPSTKKGKLLNENVYIYNEGVIPPWRQMFYQYCDIHVAEVQEMFAKLPDPLPGTKCHEKLGWLPNYFSEQVREIINKHVLIFLRKQKNIPVDHPTSLPRKKKFPGLKINSRRSAKKTNRSKK